MLTRAYQDPAGVVDGVIIAVVVLVGISCGYPAWSASVDTRFMPNCLGPGVYTGTANVTYRGHHREASPASNHRAGRP